MANIEDRVVSMSFENTKFQTGVSTTLTSIEKLNAALKGLGATSGLDNIEKSANKVTFTGLSSAIDKIKAKFGYGIPEAADAFSNVEKSADKIGFTGLTSALDKVKGQISFPQAAEGFNGIEKAADHVSFGGLTKSADTAFANVERSSGRVSFQGLTDALSNVSSHFSIVEGAAAVAFGNIATRASLAGGQAVKGFLNPIKDGFQEYQTNLNSIQTILANTQASGAKLKDVQNALNNLNHYSDKTIYNFSEMARNIGTFTAAGVDLKTSTESIKGIANLAAVSGSNSQQASTAMYQLSQAISSGRVSLQDWNSVVNAGMGGTVFQRALAQTAEKMGKLKDGAVALKGPMKNVSIDGKSFRESITAKPGEQSWLTSDVLTNTLKQFTGDLSDADLAAQGFNKSEIKAIQAQAKTAQQAATQVKTLSALLDTTKEAIGSGWTTTWQIIFGDFKEAPKLFTGISNALNGLVQDNANARNKLLQDWKDLGGRTLLIDSIKQAFKDLAAVVKPIKDAFREIFPPATGKSLFELTQRFHDLMENLKIGPETADGLKRTFAGFFAVLDIGKQILSGIFTALGHMFSAVGDGSGGILGLTGNLGDLLVKLDQWLKKGDKIKSVFAVLGDALSVPIHLIGTLTGKLNGLFSGGGNVAGGAAKSVGNLGASLKPAEKAADAVKSAFDALIGAASKVAAFVTPVLKGVGDAFSDIGSAIADGISHADFNKVFAVLNTALIGGIFLSVKKALGGGGKKGIFGDINVMLGGNAMKSISSSFDVLRGSLVSIQKNIQAHTLLLIASAVGVLTASVVALSLVKPEKLASSMTAITIGMAQLMGVMTLLGKGSGGASFAKMPVIAGSMILLATAIDILSISVIALAQLDWEQLAKGLTGVAGLLAILSIAIQPLSKAGPGLIIAGAGLVAVGAGLLVMSAPMKVFATMKWEEMGKGLAGVAGALLVVGAAARALPMNLAITGAGLVLLGIGLGAIAGVVRIFATMDWKTMGKGLAGMAAALVAIGLAMQLMPLTLPLTAAGLILVGIGLTGVAGAIALMGKMKTGTLVKGITALAATLAVLAVGMTAMVAALPGAAALLVISAALAIFVPVLGILGNMSWATIAKGLAAIAASFIVIGVAGALAGPAFVILGAGMALLGAGIAGLGAGVMLLAKGLALLGGDGAKGVAVLTAALAALIASIPAMIISFAKGLVEIQASLIALAPKLVASMVTIIGMVLAAIIAQAPKFGEAAIALITAILNVLDQKAGAVISAGWNLLIKLLQGISQHIGQVTSQVADIVTKFLSALANKMPGIVTAGANMLVGLLKGIGDNLGKVATSVATLLTKFVGAIDNGLTALVTSGAKVATKFVSGIASRASDLVSAGATALAKFLSGVANNIEDIAAKGVTIASKLISAVSKGTLKLVDEGAKALVRFLNGLADAINKYEPQIIAAGARIGAAIITGVVKGLVDFAPHAFNKAQEIGGKVLHFLGKAAKLGSPSKATYEMAGYIIQGLANGMSDNAGLATAAADGIGNSIITKFRDVFQIQSPSQVMREIGQQVGAGFKQGLVGSQDDINSAFSELNAKLQQEIQTAHDSIGGLNSKLDDLEKHRKKNKDAIHATNKELDAENSLLTKLTHAHSELVKGLASKKAELITLANQYDAVTKQMQDAQSALDQFKSQFGQLPEIPTVDAEGNALDPAAQLAAYTAAVTNQTDAVAQYHAVLDKLRKLGLDDATYKKLVDEGPADLAFAQQLADGGKAAVDNLNNLDKGLQTQANAISESAAAALYGIGVNASKGLIEGFKSMQGELKKQMEKIAHDMVVAIKKKLHIKSPSQEFMEIGKFSTEGLVVGLRASSGAVVDAAASIGDDALVALRDSMSHISDALDEHIDMNPTITPVLDLSDIQAGAKKMTALTSATSYGLAVSVASDQVPNSNGENTPGESPGGTFEFNQYNTSPKALSELEIYRQTNNQLSQVKDVLGL